MTTLIRTRLVGLATTLALVAVAACSSGPVSIGGGGSCEFNGTVFADGSQVLGAVGSCGTCVCSNGAVSCDRSCDTGSVEDASTGYLRDASVTLDAALDEDASTGVTLDASEVYDAGIVYDASEVYDAGIVYDASDVFDGGPCDASAPDGSFDASDDAGPWDAVAPDGSFDASGFDASPDSAACGY
jgi:hypothetical protein